MSGMPRDDAKPPTQLLRLETLDYRDLINASRSLQSREDT
jgi:hypothetical protein